MHRNNHSLPLAAFVGRMQYVPTLPKNLKSKNKNESGIRVGAYCIRPTKFYQGIFYAAKYVSSPPPAAFVRRMLLRPYRITGMESIK